MVAVTDFFGTVQLTAATEITVTLDPRYAYQVQHTGKDEANVDDGPSAYPAFLSYATGVTATGVTEDDKYTLVDGQSVEIGPGITTLYIDSIADADGVLAFSRQGIQTRAF